MNRRSGELLLFLACVIVLGSVIAMVAVNEALCPSEPSFRNIEDMVQDALRREIKAMETNAICVESLE